MSETIIWEGQHEGTETRMITREVEKDISGDRMQVQLETAVQVKRAEGWDDSDHGPFRFAVAQLAALAKFPNLKETKHWEMSDDDRTLLTSIHSVLPFDAKTRDGDNASARLYRAKDDLLPKGQGAMQAIMDKPELKDAIVPTMTKIRGCMYILDLFPDAEPQLEFGLAEMRAAREVFQSHGVYKD